MSGRNVGVRISVNDDPVEVFREAGVVLPGWCMGAGVCGLCRVRVAAGERPPISEADRSFLKSTELQSGWRLACQMPPGDYTVDPVPFTSDDVALDPPEKIIEPSFWPGKPGPGISVDAGTTTVMATVFGEHGNPGPVCHVYNRQAVFGANVIDRLTAAREEVHRRRLQELAMVSISSVTGAALASRHIDTPIWAAVVGNTAMHHLLAGLNVTSLSTYPYVPAAGAGFEWRSVRIRADTSAQEIEAVLVPPLGGFVGSDALASVAVVRDRLDLDCWVLIDIGTNCEVVLGLGDDCFYASAPAGPAFEGGHLTCGMRAENGAIDRITEQHGRVNWTVIGEATPRGLCGAAAVDLLAVLRRCGVVDASGRLRESGTAPLLEGFPGVTLTQRDIRELQKAKAAVEFSVRGVMKKAKVVARDLEAVVIAGGFGKGLDIQHAQDIGLLPSLDTATFSLGGNLALLGAGMTLDSGLVEQTRRNGHRVILHGKESGEHYAAALALRPWES